MKAMTAFFNISVGGADVARAFLSLTPDKSIVVDLLEGDSHVKLIGSDLKQISAIIGNHLVTKHANGKLDVREAEPAVLPDYEKKFREIKDELLSVLRK
jgi:hypothetical protein